MGEYRSRAQMILNFVKLKNAGLEPSDVLKEIHDYFLSKGFYYDRHLGYIIDKEWGDSDWLPVVMGLDDMVSLDYFFNFDTDWIGETIDLTDSIRKMAEGQEAD